MSATEPQAQTPLARQLDRCATICEETVAVYLQDPESAGSRALATVMMAIAGMERAASAAPDDPMHEAALLVAASLARDAAAAVRTQGLDESLLRCAEACDRAALLCERAVRRA